ncbi:MAG: adenosylmethionine--8-amino-7-oxononanoate transaminase [Thaumarchaeota archaeon]|nr:adenosylmethionine--8-amino-7-oxononanoate transaminase [Nitrososphaerota archaeon]MDD9809007.1 adenosylmethionine--8-amino-7-oxononanoate transaminase [Nitrososphaerota archaeon]MDD9812883.1 adenosylmethionine--8-amino-7-oxononanoate transaminase [Nitrososphaerota archaeon]MDD9826241.1 adenosylmethionine--8-amino-7-oxononanoate transaminase [Nitrososphaerota archaeon]MDD9843561.1 adenosylmethionine--8-amino-7-oxononanoate transaminase [Nitrososphaerota archaeon]
MARVAGRRAQGRVWHPNTQMREWGAFDEVVRGEGMSLVCADGTRLLDGVASMWCNVWGHSRRELSRAMARQASTLAHSPLFNLTHGPAERLARELVAVAPGMARVFYSDNGSTAMEVATKMAVQHWQNLGERSRAAIVALEGGYHGDTFGAMSVGYVPQFFSRFRRRLFGVSRVPAPGARYRGLGAADDASQCAEAAERRLARGDVAALVMESGAQMAGGVRIYPAGYQREIARACRRHGALLVLDEVATGFGRLGSMAEYAAQRCRPDIAAFGKMLTGGYATMGATLATRAVYESFLGDHSELRHLFHGHTYTGNPVAAAVALENMRLYRRHGLIARVRATSRVLGGHAAEMARIPGVADVRHRGMAMGIELARARRAPPGAPSVNRVVYEEGRRRGVYLRALGDIVMVVPPLAMPAPQVRRLCGAVAGTVAAVARRLE